MDLQRHFRAVAIVRNNHQTIVISVKNKLSNIGQLRYFFHFSRIEQLILSLYFSLGSIALYFIQAT